MRTKPYTNIGIKRISCLRCGKPSRYQWNICALGNAFYTVCAECDIALNEAVLNFFNFENKKEIIKNYRKRVKYETL